jgi:hypothetical protein
MCSQDNNRNFDSVNLHLVMYSLFVIIVFYSISTDKKFCDYPGCTCYYHKDPCPQGYYYCRSTRYCSLSTNKPCCYW